MPEPSLDAPLLDLLTRYVSQATEHAIIVLDSAGIIVGWLGAAERVFGHSADEAVGQPIALIFTSEDKARGFDNYERDLARAHSRSEDDRWHLRKDGSRIWVTGALEAVKDDSGELLGYVKLMRDRTDLRAHTEWLENQLQSQGSANIRTNLFLSTLGHELRNPLGPLQNAAHIVQRLSTDPRTDKAAEVMINQVGVLARLAEDLMEVSRAQAGKIELDMQRTDLRDMLNETALALRPSALDKGVLLECVMPPAPLPVKLDVLRFPRVVLNLVGNAIKYTPAGGSVWIKATQEGNDVLLRVEDTGIGIVPDMLPRIFDLFTQERQAQDMVPGGLGIGLAIAKQLVELHGGNVQARSAGAGKGAEFTVRLPACSE